MVLARRALHVYHGCIFSLPTTACAKSAFSEGNLGRGDLTAISPFQIPITGDNR